MTEDILVIEDDQDIAELMRIYLSNQGYTVHVVSDGREALEQWERLHPILVILDLMLPHLDGMEICRAIRSSSATPIIVVTAKVELYDKLRCFDLGADDYLVKPFDPLELVARVKAVLRRQGTSPSTARAPQPVSLPGLTVDIENYTVTVDGQNIELTRRETELLYFLAANPGRVFTREYLLQQLWGYDYPGGTRTVDVHINRLRDKVEHPHLPWQICTIWGVGYKFEVK